MKFPGEDGGRSLAEMAQSDLDAALQLLADRAQYITGAGGAAIALRRDGKNDLLCRASAGENAPELGALLSTEFGLSGESVRTRKALRCDDAERDSRVNREVCRELGIASVVVMPVVHDDHVLGVFELFSGKANAFGERDLTALERLSGMVETAVRLAQAAESVSGLASAQEKQVENKAAVAEPVTTAEFVADLTAELAATPIAATPPVVKQAAAAVKVPLDPVPAPVAPVAQAPISVNAPIKDIPAPAAKVEKRLFWSAALNEVQGPAAAEADQSQVPPVLRGLRKCEACGFPVSAGRTLCVECEEKKWRGQLKPRTTTVVAQSAAVAAAPARDAAPQQAAPPEAAKPVDTVAAKTEETPAVAQPAPMPDFVLSAGLPQSQSWLARNKYVVGVILLAASVIAALAFIR